MELGVAGTLIHMHYIFKQNNTFIYNNHYFTMIFAKYGRNGATLSLPKLKEWLPPIFMDSEIWYSK